VFTTIVSFGPAPRALAVAADGLITSLRSPNRRLQRVLFNFAEPALSVAVASVCFTYVSGLAPLAQADAPLTRLLVPVLTMSAVFFILNSGLTAVAMAMEAGTSPFQVWRMHFAWLWLNYFGGASIALFLTINAREITLSGIAPRCRSCSCSTSRSSRAFSGIEEGREHLAELNRLHLATAESLAMAVDARDSTPTATRDACRPTRSPSPSAWASPTKRS